MPSAVHNEKDTMSEPKNYNLNQSRGNNRNGGTFCKRAAETLARCRCHRACGSSLHYNSSTGLEIFKIKSSQQLTNKHEKHVFMPVHSHMPQMPPLSLLSFPDKPLIPPFSGLPHTRQKNALYTDISGHHKCLPTLPSIPVT